MLTFLRTRSLGQLVVIAVVVLVVSETVLVLLALPASSPRTTSPRRPAPTNTSSLAAAPALSAQPSSTSSIVAPEAGELPRTASADVYAAAVAKALWNVDYASTSRVAVLAFWRTQLADVLPAGTPAGTTIGEAQAAGLSTISDYLPSAAMWSTLGRDGTASSFTVTGVSEPASWVEAVSSGKIVDPGLTAREVIGVQRITYGRSGAQQATAQTQQLIVAMLCPPTSDACTVEVFPPRDPSGVSG